MAFHGVLYRISEELEIENLQALKFLCLGQIPLGKRNGIQDGKDLFLMLQEKGLLHEGDLSFLRELMLKIKRIDLLEQKLSTSKEEAERALQTPGQAKVCPYRYMLFQVSENMTTADLTHFKFLINELPKSKLGKASKISDLQKPLCEPTLRFDHIIVKGTPVITINTTILDIFIEMEKIGLLGENKLDILKDKCKKVDQGLVEIIEKYQRNTTAAMAALTEGSNSMESRNVPEAVGAPRPIVVCSNPFPEHTQQPFKALFCLPTRLLCPVPTPEDLFYKMTSRPRGICLIVNNSNFAESRESFNKYCKDRIGTDVDKDALSKVFSQLHFQIEISKDVTSDEIQQALKSYGAADHKNYDCFVCCVLSHGEKGSVLGTDGREIAIRKLTSYFSSLKCPSLAGKPKVFFIQACQGESFHPGLVYYGYSTCSKPSEQGGSKPPAQCIPDEADFLLGMATVDDYVSYRSPTTGTWYIQSLCKHLLQSCPSGDDILSILTRVNNEVGNMYDKRNRGMQMPQPSFTLRKKLVFPMN